MYEAFLVEADWWQATLPDFLEMCLSSQQPYSIPYGNMALWLLSPRVQAPVIVTIIVQSHLLPVCQTVGRMILNRIRPIIDPCPDECQTRFRHGSDVEAYVLVVKCWNLRLRQNVRTYCAFLDIRKAWRHAAAESNDLWP